GGDVAERVDAQRDALWHARHRRGRLVEPEPELGSREDAAFLAGDQANPDVAAFLAEPLLLLSPVSVVGQSEPLVQYALVVPTVVHVAGGDEVRELVGPDEVLAPNFDWIHLQLAGR